MDTPRALARIIRQKLARDRGKRAIVYAIRATIYSCSASTKHAARVLAEEPLRGEVVGIYSKRHSVGDIANDLLRFRQSATAAEILRTIC